VLEVTETALIDDVESATAILARLKEIGVRIAVDDFGTGYSSLTHLVKFPLDIVKIDKSFVDRVANGNGGDVMVRAVIDLSHKLGLATVAEGVEVDLQALALEDLACRWAQGYLYSRPVPAEDMAALLDARHLPATRQKRGGAVRAS
jgi:EAL domain-containing protein (putative c-di-GMP-specific phosphodiesterase class I)